MHSFNASENDTRTSEFLEAEDRSGFSFDGSVILLDEVVEILALSDRYVDVILTIEILDARLVGAALIDIGYARKTIVLDGTRWKRI